MAEVYKQGSKVTVKLSDTDKAAAEALGMTLSEFALEIVRIKYAPKCESEAALTPPTLRQDTQRSSWDPPELPAFPFWLFT